MAQMITQEYLKSIMDYDPETGVFRWRVKRSNVPAGTEIGRGCTAWYKQAGIDGRLYDNPRDAYAAYVTAAEQFHGEFARVA